MALWPPALADASSFCPTENSQPVLSHTLKAQKHKNAMSQRSCRAKIFVRPASHLHCTTKANLCMSAWTAGGQSPTCGAPTRRGVQCMASSYRTQSSKSLDTNERSGYALLMRRLDQCPARADDPSAHRGDVYDQGRARRPGGRHRPTLEGANRHGAHAVLADDYG